MSKKFLWEEGDVTFGPAPEKKFNPYHDEHGMFTDAGSAAGVSIAPVGSGAYQHTLGFGASSPGVYTAPIIAPVVTPVNADTIMAKPTYSNLDDRDAYLKSHEHDVEELTYSQNAALESYTGSGYLSMNTALRSGKWSSYGGDDNLDYVNKLTEALNSTTLEQAVVTYRGMDISEERIEKMSNSVGKTFTDKAFSSTSIDKDKATSFAGDRGIIATITVPAFSHGIYVPTSESASSMDEHELLLQKGGVYRIDKFTPAVDYGYHPMVDLTYIEGDDNLL